MRPPSLEGRFVRLAPLEADHLDALCAIGLDPRLWERTTIRVTTREEMARYIRRALDQAEAGRAAPFVIHWRATDEIVGTTRYHSIALDEGRLEIGYSWIASAWQRSAVNTEAKYLLLRHAFERLGIRRVEFRADAENDRSCAALRRIGALEEATLRHYMVSAHRGPRDVKVFSILADEWPSVSDRLRHRLYGGTDGGE